MWGVVETQHALDFWWSMVFSEKPVFAHRVKPEGMLFRIML
jgi:hypothetical protein